MQRVCVLRPASSARTIGALKMMGRSAMTDIPWDAAATAWLYVRGLNREKADSVGFTLRDAVIFVLSQTNARGDGYIIKLDDGSRQWEGPEIVALGRVMSNR